MLIEYGRFYRKFGVRKVGQLLMPPTVLYSDLKLPKLSSVHFPQFEDEDFEIPQDHLLAKGIKRHMFCEIADHYSAEDDGLGLYRLAPGNPLSMTRHYFRMNKRIRPYNPEKPVHDQQTLVFHTYGLLNKRYIYLAKKRDTELNKWKNHWDTVITSVNREAEAGLRHQFIVIDVPTDIPAMTKLRKNDVLDITTVRYFHNPDHWLVQSLWNFFTADEDRVGGVPYIFRNLSNDVLKNVNVIWKYGNICTITNLGVLLSFNSAFEDKGKYNSLRFNKYILNMFLTLRETTEVRDADELDTDAISDNVREEDSKNIYDEDTVEGDLDDEVLLDDDSDIPEEEDLDALFDGLDFDDDISDTDWLAREADRKILKPDGSTDLNITPTKKVKALSKNNTVNDEDVDIEETADSIVDSRLDALEAMQETIEEDDEDIDSENLAYKTYEPELVTTVDYDKLIVGAATEQARSGIITAGELRLAAKRAETYKTLKDPRDPKKAFVDSLAVSEEEISLDGDTEIANDVTKALVPDETMYNSSLKQFDRKYIKEVMPKHIAMTVMEVAKAGVTVQDYDIERVKNINDDFEIHSIRLTTIAGKQSTLRFRLPVVNESGEFKAGGVKLRMRKQWADLPIRKISPSEVALTSYYSKLFVRRTSRAAFNYEKWLMDYIVSTGIDGGNDSITELKLNDVFDNNITLPREYTIISRRVSSFISKGYVFYFDKSNIESNFPNAKKSTSVFPVAKSVTDDTDIIYMDMKTGWIKVKESIMTLEEFLEIDTSKAPEDYAELSFLGKPIPLVFIIGYWVGLGNLLKTLGVNYTRVKQVSSDMKEGYLAVRFKDETLLFDNRDKKACLIVNGLNRFRNEIKKHSVYAFDNREVYSTVFDDTGLNVRYLKECQTMFPMWVDHITRDVLIEMKEPTELTLLFIRAVELLLTDQHPDSMDTAYMRIKGYERFSGLLYSEMVKEIRNFNYRPNRKDKALSMNPEQVWYSILKDETVIVVEESNPIHNLKEQEIVVYRGTGGRSGRSMVASARKYHKNGMGVVSEATVDSKDVGAVTYLTPDANLGSLYGTIETIDPSVEQPPGKLISTSALLAPGADIDDPKRTGFVSVQNSQTMAANGYQLLPVRTGYERVVGSRSTETFCKTADADGVVTDIGSGVVSVEYADGSVGKYDIGTKYAPWSGKTVTQNLITTLKKGDTFTKGQVITYNKGFFKPDKLAPGQVSLVTQTLARVAFIEGGDVYEDSAAISSDFANKLNSELAYVRNITVSDTQDIRDLVQVGDRIEPDTILCTIVNAQTDTSFYDKETLLLLERIASTTPKAKHHGVVSKIEIIYTGEVDDMPENLKDAAIISDREIYRTSRKKGEPVVNGRVDIGFTVDGVALGKNTTVIKVYLTVNLSMSTGDKIVVANQLKGTIARVWSDNNTDEDGAAIDAYFSGYSTDKRIVDSPFLIGSTGSLMLAITQKAIDHYFE